MNNSAKTNEALSREIRRLNTKLTLAEETSKRGHRADALEAEVATLRTTAARVPDLETCVLDLRIEMSKAAGDALDAGAGAAAARLDAIEARAAARAAAVETARTVLRWEAAAARAEEEGDSVVTGGKDGASEVQDQFRGTEAAQTSLRVRRRADLDAARKEAKAWKTSCQASEKRLAATEKKLADAGKQAAAAEQRASHAERELAAAEEGADKKIADALVQIQASAAASARGMHRGAGPALGGTFSPAPLAGSTALGRPATLTPVRDIASESRSRFTTTLPYDGDEVAPLALPIPIDAREAADAAGRRAARRGRRKYRTEPVVGPADPGAVPKRPRERLHETPGNGDEEDDEDGDDAAAATETESLSADVARPTGKMMMTKSTASSDRAVDAEAKTAPSKRATSEEASPGGSKSRQKRDRPAAASGGSGATKVPAKKRVRNAPAADRRPTVSAVSPRTDGRTSRQRKHVSYDYSIGNGADISFEFAGQGERGS
jgi:hypothetical protein